LRPSVGVATTLAKVKLELAKLDVFSAIVYSITNAIKKSEKAIKMISRETNLIMKEALASFTI